MSGRHWYLATPYSKFEDGIEAAFVEASQQAAILIRAGIHVFCPIAHSHPIAMHGGIDPYDHEIWLPADAPMMEAACGLIVCKLPGWEASVGIEHEIAAFKAAGKPVVGMKPGVLPERQIRGAEAVIDSAGQIRSEGGCVVRPHP